MKTSVEQRRRRDEKVQDELMGGKQRILDVLHGTSSGATSMSSLSTFLRSTRRPPHICSAGQSVTLSRPTGNRCIA